MDTFEAAVELTKAIVRKDGFFGFRGRTTEEELKECARIVAMFVKALEGHLQAPSPEESDS